MDALEVDLTFRLDVLLALVAQGLAVMLPVFTEQPVTTLELIQAALVTAHVQAKTLQDQIDTARDV